ncbi:MAG: AAA family ATPase [Actinomycetes bacterium]
MLENAVRASRFVVLIGPPGTGKGTLIQDLVARVASDPGAFGFGTHAAGWPNPVKRTPDDSWTAFDLVGGLVPSGTGLVFSPGLLPSALEQDRWLILDELNRGELDKIFGPVLTWLAEEEVDLGRLDTTPSAPEIKLDWDLLNPRSRVDPAQGLGSPTGPIRYVAGNDWRLLGTYNPQDAQRVFGIGQALGRRFRQVPIPALDPDQFLDLLTDRVPGCPGHLATLIEAVYEGHFENTQFRLGPALFLEMGRYVAAAAGQGAMATTDEPEILAEGYVVAIGRFLSGFREIDREVLASTDAFKNAFGAEWAWIQEQLGMLR